MATHKAVAVGCVGVDALDTSARLSSRGKLKYMRCQWERLRHAIFKGLLRELNPGPLAPGARIIPLDQAANEKMSGILTEQGRTKSPLAFEVGGKARCAYI